MWWTFEVNFCRLRPMKYFLASCFLGLGLLSACSSTPTGVDPNSAEGMFKTAEELEGDDRYDEAITKFNELKNKYPYSHFATDAELRVADIQFKREAFIEAQTAYQL